MRELKNVIERALIESGGEEVKPPHLRLHALACQPPAPRRPRPAPATDELPLNLEAAETLLIRRALAETGGNIAEAARRLGVNRTRIYRKLGEQAP